MANQEFLNLIESALDEANDFLGDSFYYGGVSYSGIISDVEYTSTLESGGLIEGLATVIVVPLTQLATAPTVGETVKVGFKTLRIEKVKTDEISIELTCITAAK